MGIIPLVDGADAASELTFSLPSRPRERRGLLARIAHRLRHPTREQNAVAADAWGWVSASRSTGSWLMCRRGARVVTYAPPGVVIDESADDDLAYWREATWAEDAAILCGHPPASLHRRSVEEVHARVPADFARWVDAATRDQIDTLGWFAATATEDDRHARAARSTRDRLVAELDACDGELRRSSSTS